MAAGRTYFSFSKTGERCLLNDLMEAGFEVSEEILAAARTVDQMPMLREAPLNFTMQQQLVARGDFNVHSDIDVVIISDYLPSNPLERSEFLYRFVTPRIEPKGFTIGEWEVLQERKNPLALEVLNRRRSFKIFPPQ